MDVLQQLVVHHVDSLAAIIDRAERLDDAVLDQPIAVSVETIDGEQTLRSLINAMVTQEEHWLSALRGGGWPDESDQSVAGRRETPDARTKLKKRYPAVAASFTPSIL